MARVLPVDSRMGCLAFGAPRFRLLRQNLDLLRRLSKQYGFFFFPPTSQKKRVQGSYAFKLGDWMTLGDRTRFEKNTVQLGLQSDNTKGPHHHHPVPALSVALKQRDS